MAQGLYVRQLKLGPMEAFAYLVGAEGARETAIVDAAWEVDEALAAAAADGREVTHALVSHWHFDHTNGLAPLLEKQGVSVCAHTKDAPRLPKEVRGEITQVVGGEAVGVRPPRVRALAPPAHTPGSVTGRLEAAPGGSPRAVLS